jgi:hypothetical protein
MTVLEVRSDAVFTSFPRSPVGMPSSTLFVVRLAKVADAERGNE